MRLNHHLSVKKLSIKDTHKILENIEYRINLFDITQVYGPNINEELIEQILKYYKNKVILSTKFSFDKDVSKLDSYPK